MRQKAGACQIRLFPLNNKMFTLFRCFVSDRKHFVYENLGTGAGVSRNKAEHQL
jgi:hypothetical protein